VDLRAIAVSIWFFCVEISKSEDIGKNDIVLG
jgi:hypothetical protein